MFIWIINAKYEFALQMIEKNGFELVDEIVWVKTTVNRRVARSHGFYLQHGYFYMGLVLIIMFNIVSLGRRHALWPEKESILIMPS